MARQISRAEAWERAHEVYTQVNFNSFDYNTIKESLLDYTKLYFPEDFSDYIESSEFISILELFAYVGELLAYRIDMNAHENFMTTAQRKESVLRLAKMLSYKASRNIPARGLVKITSVQTTERLADSAGRNLTSRRVYWADANNPNWKEQFTLIINRIMEQPFGSVDPGSRMTMDDVLFELYTLNNNPILPNGKSVISYAATADGENVPMELVPVTLTKNGPEERRPETNLKFSILYSSDGLGDTSDTTGFMLFTKQGTLAFTTEQFDGITPNQTYDIPVSNINETDIWVQKVDPQTGSVLINDPNANVLPHLVAEDARYGDWVEVDLANAQNIIFNTNKNRHKYEVETLDNDQVKLIFGDGEFSDIPGGTFQIWYRTSANQDLYIERNSVVDQVASMTYMDVNGNTQTFTFTFSLVSSLQNASASEDIEHIRRIAPSMYYTQDRMVNGRDYNTFLLQDPSVLRLRTVNRTFAGDSKYIAWHDPKEYYDNVKLFGDDLALYWDGRPPEEGNLISISSPINPDQVLQNYLQPLLSTTDVFSLLSPHLQQLGQNPGDYRRVFTLTERTQIIDMLSDPNIDVIYLVYTPNVDLWEAKDDMMFDITTTIHVATVTKTFNQDQLSGWDIHSQTRKLIAHSDTTKFWNNNQGQTSIDLDTLSTIQDKIVVLKANTDGSMTNILSTNKDYSVLSLESDTMSNPSIGIPDQHKVSIMPTDNNDDSVPDDILQSSLFQSIFSMNWSQVPIGTVAGSPSTLYIDLSQLGLGETINNADYPKGLDADIEVYIDGERIKFESGELFPLSTDLIIDRIGIDPNVIGGSPDPEVTIKFNRFVYFTRESNEDAFAPVESSAQVRTSYMLDDENVRRFNGRYPLNFAWFHYTPRLHLVDPAASNIHDMFIITKGYYTGMQRWITGRTTIRPQAPTSLELRNTYASLLENGMLSDTIIPHSGEFKILFGPKAPPELRCRFKVIRPERSSLTDNEVKVRITNVIRAFFDINNWEFGEQFFYTEMAASIHAELGNEIDSVVLVPLFSQHQFGDLFQVQASENELFLPDISPSDIDIVAAYSPEVIRQ